MNITINSSGNLVRQNVEVSTLTRQQAERVSYLSKSYKESSADLVRLIEPRGKNSWLMVDRKINLINQLGQKDKLYYDLISDNFDIETIYTLSDIIGIIAEIRRDMSIPAYLTRLQAQCETDFLTMFIVDDVYKDIRIDSDGKRQFINFVGYVPTFKLRPDDL